MKKCPYCVEEIQDDATRCKHCGANLNIKERATNHAIWSSIGVIIVLVFMDLVTKGWDPNKVSWLWILFVGIVGYPTTYYGTIHMLKKKEKR